MKEIEERYEVFENIYIRKIHGIITKENMLEEMRKVVANMDNSAKREYAFIGKMFSKANCGYTTYKTAEIVHKLLMEALYPNNKKEPNTLDKLEILLQKSLNKSLKYLDNNEIEAYRNTLFGAERIIMIESRIRQMYK